MVVLGSLDHPAGRLGGATLVAAGVIVGLMRRRYRRAKTSGSRSTSRNGAAARASNATLVSRSYYNNYD
jgi:hypothetical protein